MTKSQQTIVAQTYTFSQYTYNLADAPTSETYPSGRVVNMDYDPANQVKTLYGTFRGQQTKLRLQSHL